MFLVFLEHQKPNSEARDKEEKKKKLVALGYSIK